MSYDKIISLGGNCEVAFHIRRHTALHTANIMDWWITPLASIPKLLGEKFRNVARFENMRLINEGRTVFCAHYGIAHHHDFPRLSDIRIDPVRIEATCREIRGKYAMLTSRFLDDCNGQQRILFVRGWRETLGTPLPNTASDDVIRYDFDTTIASIASAYPSLKFKVLFVNYGPQQSKNPCAIFHNIDEKGDVFDWTGSTGGWDEMFSLYC